MLALSAKNVKGVVSTSRNALTSLLTNTISFSHIKVGDVESVDASLNLGRVSPSITIMRLGTFVDFSASFVTKEYWELELPTYSSRLLHMSLTLQLPERLVEKL
jgi:hypothetical protein